MPFQVRIAAVFLGVVCILSAALGLFCLFIYARTIIETWGASDRSLLFWYAPFLFAGMILAIVSGAAGLKLRRLLWSPKWRSSQDRDSGSTEH